jgi:hypothetical protein
VSGCTKHHAGNQCCKRENLLIHGISGFIMQGLFSATAQHAGEQSVKQIGTSANVMGMVSR